MIDIRQLTIGSHLNVNGARAKICAVTKRKIGYHHGKPDGHLRYARLHEVEPIEITPALLEELGFEWRKDSSCWRRYEGYNGETYDWGLYVSQAGGGWDIQAYLPDFRMRPRLYAKYLHELEGQLAYYGVELIKD